MSSPKNLQRDMMWLDPSQATVVWPTTTSKINSSGVVNQDKGFQAWNAVTDGSAVDTMIGVLMQQPTGENTAYRVKAMIQTGTVPLFRVGYMSGSITGTNDSIGNSVLIPCPGNTQRWWIDEVVCLEATNGSDPVFFACRAPGTSISVQGVISVQRLNVAPPRYASVVS